MNTETGAIVCKEYTHDIDIVLQEMKRLKYPKMCVEYYASKNRVNSQYK